MIIRHDSGQSEEAAGATTVLIQPGLASPDPTVTLKTPPAGTELLFVDPTIAALEEAAFRQGYEQGREDGYELGIAHGTLYVRGPNIKES